MPEIVIPYAPRPHQALVHERRRRWTGLVCHRRWGKTVWAVNELIKGALTCGLERPRFAYVAPSPGVPGRSGSPGVGSNQAKAIAWDYLCAYTAPIPGREVNVTELRVDLPGGRQVRLFGADRPNALRGLCFDGLVLDEDDPGVPTRPAAWGGGDMDPALFPAVVRPALADRLGWAAFAGTPKGRNHFAIKIDELKRDAAAGCPATGVHLFRASETGIIDPAELERLRRSSTPPPGRRRRTVVLPGSLSRLHRVV